MCDVPLHEEDATLTYETLSSSFAVVSDPHRVKRPDFSDGDLDRRFPNHINDVMYSCEQ